MHHAAAHTSSASLRNTQHGCFVATGLTFHLHKCMRDGQSAHNHAVHMAQWPQPAPISSLGNVILLGCASTLKHSSSGWLPSCRGAFGHQEIAIMGSWKESTATLLRPINICSALYLSHRNVSACRHISQWRITACQHSEGEFLTIPPTRRTPC